MRETVGTMLKGGVKDSGKTFREDVEGGGRRVSDGVEDIGKNFKDVERWKGGAVVRGRQREDVQRCGGWWKDDERRCGRQWKTFKEDVEGGGRRLSGSVEDNGRRSKKKWRMVEGG